MKHRLTASLGLFPGLAAALAIVVGVLLPRFEAQRAHQEVGWYGFGGGADSARDLLSTISASIITLTALVFSITVLVLQLASSQYSPRVIGTFLRERWTKLTLAVFVGTFVYSMIVLAQVRSEPESVPSLSIWIAFSLLLLCVLVFIRYIDRMTHSIRAVTLIKRVASETRRVLGDIHENCSSDEAASSHDYPSAPPQEVLANEVNPGVLAAIDVEMLTKLAAEARGTLELVPRVGAFIPKGAPLLRFWGAGELDQARASSALSIEDERTVEQDPAFGFRLLVDIAVRALSPGVNDPTTAVQAVDHLHDLVRYLTSCNFPTHSCKDDAGSLRVIVRRPSYADYVRLAFEEIASYATQSIHVKRRLRLTFDDLLNVASPERCSVLNDERGRLEID